MLVMAGLAKCWGLGRVQLLRWLGGGACFMLLGCGAPASDSREVAARGQSVIYGEDDRVEARQYADRRFVELATQVVGALVPRSALRARPQCEWLLEGPGLGEQQRLCPDETLLEQISVAICTATLVGPDVILTAGHCLRYHELESLVFVRGYALGAGFPRLQSDQVHELVEVLTSADGGTTHEPEPDVALVRVLVQSPLAFVDVRGSSSALTPGDGVVVIGTSEGVPIKIDAGGVVFDVAAPDTFEVTSDTFMRGSGSAVFSPQGELLGTVVGGNPDYEWDEALACNHRRRIEPEASAELVVRIDAVRSMQPFLVRSAAENVTPMLDCPTTSDAGAGNQEAGNGSAGELGRARVRGGQSLDCALDSRISRAHSHSLLAMWLPWLLLAAAILRRGQCSAAMISTISIGRPS